MKTIWKYQLEITDRQVVKMPGGAKILSTQFQHGELCFWAMVNSEAPTENVIIEVIGTGNPMPTREGAEREYIGTAQMSGGRFVWHVFILANDQGHQSQPGARAWQQLKGPNHMETETHNGLGLGAPPCSEYMFEIADASDEECFFTIGVFLSLEEAVAAIEAKKEPWQLCESAMFSNDYAAMEIRKKKLGILDPLNNGEVVWSRKWNNVYVEDKDDDDWRVILERRYYSSER